MNISYGTVYQWVKRWGDEVELPRSSETVEIVELDEIHTYISSKNYRWIWISVDRLGKRFINFVCGDRSTKTGVKLWESIEHLDIRCCCSDYWKSYKEFVPKEIHVQTHIQLKDITV